MRRILVEDFIAGISDADIENYSKYLHSIRPRNNEDLFDRFLFAYASIQTPWERNVVLYELLKDPAWREDEVILQNHLSVSRAGFHNNRFRYLTHFSRLFWEDPDKFHPLPMESWAAYRNRLVDIMLGMGIAKVSFTIEMFHPGEAQVICLDRHLLRFYKHKTENCTKSRYEEYERHWCAQCLKRNVSPTVARWIYWDKIQGKTDSRYWAHVLEKEAVVY